MALDENALRNFVSVHVSSPKEKRKQLLFELVSFNCFSVLTQNFSRFHHRP